MKKLITLTVLMCLSIQIAFAQFEVTGSKEYGRLFDVTYDPIVQNKLYAITLGNHIVTSSDNGQSWEILYSYPEQSVGLDRLRFLDGNQLTFYVRFSNNISLNLLDLNTLTITKQFVLPVPPGSDKNWIASYAIYEADTDIAIIHQGYQIGFSTFAKVYYTSDGGTTFQEIYHNVDFDEVFPNNVAIHPTNPAIVFIARGLGPTAVTGGIFKSVDAGATWVEHLAGNAFDAIDFQPQNPDTMLLGSSVTFGSQNLYRSTDTGDNWNIIPISWTNGIQDNITVIKYNPANPNNVIVLEENEIVITNDGFATWQNIVYPVVDVHSYYFGLNASFNPFNQDEVFISANYHVLFSEDGGETVSWSKNPYFSTTGNINFFNNPQESHLYYGVQLGYVHRNMQTMDEAPYEVQSLEYVSSSRITVYPDQTIPGRVYSFEGGFMGSNLYFSNDHGENREQIFSLFSSSFHAIASHPDNPNLVWASFSSFGENPELMEIDFSDINNIQVTPIALPISDVVTDMYFNQQNPDEIILSVGTNMLSTTNGGSTWTDISNGLNPLIPFQDLILKISINPLNTAQISIATNKGIFSTLNGGALWEQKTFDVTHNIAHSTETNGHLIAATHNSDISSFDVYYSTDGGENWTTIPTEDLQYVASTTTAFQFFETEADIYIGTTDLGLVKYTVDLSALSTPDFQGPNNFLQLYPNPVTDVLNLNTGAETIEQIILYTVTGQQIMVLPGASHINIAELKSGVYFVKATTTSGKSTTGKIIKR